MSDQPDRVRLALQRYAERRGTLVAKLVRDLSIETVRDATHTRAVLDSLIETRHTRLEVRPWRGAEDAPEAATPAQDLGSIRVALPTGMTEATAEVELPWGRSRHRCGYCHGEKTATCGTCGGSGSAGPRKACPECWGKGRARCATCAGSGEVMDVRMLEVVRRLETRQHIETTTQLPPGALDGVAADEEQTLEGCPVDPSRLSGLGYRDGSCRLSTEVLRELRALVDASRPSAGAALVAQRLRVQRWAIVEVDYAWDGRSCRLWMVGRGGEVVVAPDEPFESSTASRAMAVLGSALRGLTGRR